MQLWSNRCPVSGRDVPAALDAAHVIPVFRGGKDHPSNGLLLNADLHRLFDQHLIGFKPEAAGVICRLDTSLSQSEHYAAVDTHLFVYPKASEFSPSKLFLERIRKSFLYRSTQLLVLFHEPAPQS